MPIPNLKLKTALWKKDLTQRDLAFTVRIPEEKLSKIVRGFKEPEPETRKAISEYLGMPETELF